MHCPSTIHYSIIKQILRYLGGTSHLGILFLGHSLDLHIYCDADWVDDSFDRRSTSSFVIFLGNSSVAWSVKRQTTVSSSSTEVKYWSLATSAVELY